MYAYIKGIIAEKRPDSVVLEAGGVGYHIEVTADTLRRMGSVGQTTKIYTRLIVKEDAQLLYGFASQEERKMFDRLITVSGIGAKTGMAVLSAMSVSDLAVALVTDDVAALSKVSGVGKKTAQRLILELKEKVKDQVVGEQGYTSVQDGALTPVGEAISALIALGYTSVEAVKAIEGVKKEGSTSSELIRAALRQMDNQKREG